MNTRTAGTRTTGTRERTRTAPVDRPARTRDDGSPAGTRTEQTLARLTAGITALTESQAWTRWLRTQARFTDYSFGNAVLIAIQAPEATRVAGFSTWSQLGRRVRAGEKAIWILAPITRRTNSRAAAAPERPADKPDPVPVKAGAPARRVCGFRAVPVFDIAATDGVDLPEIAHRLYGAAPDGVLLRLMQVAHRLGYRVEHTALGGGRNGECHFFERRIRIEYRNSPVQQVKTLSHEIAHALLHDPAVGERIERELAECEAESVAYVTCAALGIDAGDYSFGYLASWAGGGDQAVSAIRTGGQRIHSAADRILAALDTDPGPTDEHDAA